MIRYFQMRRYQQISTSMFHLTYCCTKNNVDIWRYIISNAFSWKESLCILIQIHSPKFHPWGSINHRRQVALTCVFTYSTTIGFDNSLSPVQCQAIIWTNARFFYYWDSCKQSPVKLNFLMHIYMHQQINWVDKSYKSCCVGQLFYVGKTKKTIKKPTGVVVQIESAIYQGPI